MHSSGSDATVLLSAMRVDKGFDYIGKRLQVTALKEWKEALDREAASWLDFSSPFLDEG